MVQRWDYSVEWLEPGATYESQGGKAAVQALLKHKARDGWEFVETHPALAGDGLYYVFRLDLTASGDPTT